MILHIISIDFDIGNCTNRKEIFFTELKYINLEVVLKLKNWKCWNLVIPNPSLNLHQGWLILQVGCQSSTEIMLIKKLLALQGKKFLVFPVIASSVVNWNHVGREFLAEFKYLKIKYRKQFWNFQNIENFLSPRLKNSVLNC